MIKEGDDIWIRRYQDPPLFYFKYKFIRYGEFYNYQTKGIESGLMVLSELTDAISLFFPSSSHIQTKDPNETIQ